jgi:ABC-2 type transport system permease protein
MGALVGNAYLIKKVYFPREALVVANVASWAYSLLIEFAVATAVYLVFGNMVLPWLPIVIVVILIQSIFVLGVGLLLSVLNVYFRDVQHLITILLLVWFYATPIVYPISYVEQADAKHPELLGHAIPVLALYRLNPMVRLVGAYRDALYNLRFPSLYDLAYVTMVGAVTLAFGLWAFRRLQGRLAEEL